jgi:hypothetical protein
MTVPRQRPRLCPLDLAPRRREREMASVARESRGVSEHKRCVNDLIHERESMEEHRRLEPVAFFCECPSTDCFETVWLTGLDYELGRLDGEWSVVGSRHL